MEISQLLWGGAAFGAITSCWGYIKTFVWKLCNLFVQQIEIHEEYTANAVIGYLVQNYRKSGLYEKVYRGTFDQVRTSNRVGLVPFEQYGKSGIIFWNKLFPFFFSGSEKKKSGNTDNGYNTVNQQEVFAYITYIRGTLNIDQIIADAVLQRNNVIWDVESEQENYNRRFFIKHIPDIAKDKNKETNVNTSWWFHSSHYRLVGYTADQLGRGKPEGINLLDNLVFPEHVTTLINEIKLWRKNRQWYEKRGIPWKRGWLLYGIPGSGKTALARAFAEDLDLPIFVYNLSEMGNFEFMRAWIQMQQSTPCIALIEDIDNVFHGRENVSSRRNMWSMLSLKRDNGEDKNSSSHSGPKEDSGGMLNFDVFLNCLDGVERTEGVFTIITTNDVSKIDPALGQPCKNPDGTVEFISTRPGRIDKAIELTYMAKPEKRLLAQRILGDYPDLLGQMIDYIDGCSDEVKETPAQFQERCAQIALARFWRETHPELFLEERNQYILVENDDVETEDEAPIEACHEVV